MLGRPMPFRAVPCLVWLPTYSRDEWGNEVPGYPDEPSVTTTCCYAPGRYGTDTSNDIEDGRPNGERVRMTFFLPKSFDSDLRGALIAAAAPDDPLVAGRVFAVVGAPSSFMRDNTPGDYSWAVEGVEHLG